MPSLLPTIYTISPPVKISEAGVAATRLQMPDL